MYINTKCFSCDWNSLNDLDLFSSSTHYWQLDSLHSPMTNYDGSLAYGDSTRFDTNAPYTVPEIVVMNDMKSMSSDCSLSNIKESIMLDSSRWEYSLNVPQIWAKLMDLFQYLFFLQTMRSKKPLYRECSAKIFRCINDTTAEWNKW